MLILSALLPRVFSDFVPLEVLLFGGAMLVIVVLIHGAGLDRIVARYKRRSDLLRNKGVHPHLATLIFATSILLMLLLHITEACIWGVVLNKSGLIASLRDSIYFSANTYTTIGYGLMILPQSWRELSPIMAISGLFTFAWTTGEMFGIVGQQRELMLDLRTRRAQRNQRGQRKRAAAADTVENKESADHGKG